MSVISFIYEDETWEYDKETDELYSFSDHTRTVEQLFLENDAVYFQKSTKDKVLIFSPYDDEFAMLNRYKFIRCVRNRLKILGIIIKIKKIDINYDIRYEMIFANDADYAYFLLHFHNFCV